MTERQTLSPLGALRTAVPQVSEKFGESINGSWKRIFVPLYFLYNMDIYALGYVMDNRTTSDGENKVLQLKMLYIGIS